jgi:hypothetical protein
MVERPINKTAHTVEIFPGGRGHRTRAQVSGSQRIYPSRGGDQRLAAAAAAPIGLSQCRACSRSTAGRRIFRGAWPRAKIYVSGNWGTFGGDDVGRGLDRSRR